MERQIDGVRPPGAQSRLTAALLTALAVLPGCAGFVRYTDEITDETTGRSRLATTPATIGGVAGFVVGVPVSAIALPVTYTVYRYEDERAPLRADPMSTMLFPSFVLWRTGTLLGAPFDLLDFAMFRAWRDDRARLSLAEREPEEAEIDDSVLPAYPVTPLFPPAEQEGGDGAGA